MSKQKTSILRIAPLVAIMSVAGLGLTAQAQTTSTPTAGPGGATTVGGPTPQGSATTNPNGKRTDVSVGMDTRTGMDTRNSGTNATGGATTKMGAQGDGSGTLNANKKVARKSTTVNTESKAGVGTSSPTLPQATTNGSNAPDGSSVKKTPG